MTIEQARMRVVSKPWGSTDLRPWSGLDHDGAAIGEIWFQRADLDAPAPALLLKLLFTKEPLSIQVHPDDTFAKSIGLASGKTEAWYILAAAPGAEVAIGLTRDLEASQLRASIQDGSISDLVQWHPVLKDEAIFVPAGTIHAIGPGLVIAEIQQRSDSTFRLFDYGRHRALDIDNAVAATHYGPAPWQTDPRALTEARTLLVVSPYFVLERFTLAPNSAWELHANRETWFLILEGDGLVGQMSALVGEAFFVEEDCADIAVGAGGLKGLLAYASPEPDLGLLRALVERALSADNREFSQPSLHRQAAAGAPSRTMEVLL